MTSFRRNELTTLHMESITAQVFKQTPAAEARAKQSEFWLKTRKLTKLETKFN